MNLQGSYELRRARGTEWPRIERRVPVPTLDGDAEQTLPAEEFARSRAGKEAVNTLPSFLNSR